MPRQFARHVALHEAGHAVAHWHHGLSFRYVTMRPRQAGVVAGVRTYARVNDTPAKLIACMEIAAAGRIAQFHCFSSTPRDDTDLLALFAQAAAMSLPFSYWDPDIRQFVDAGKALDYHQWGPAGPDGWLRIWRGAEEKITGSLWPAVEAVGAKLMISTRRLTYGEVAEIAAAAMPGQPNDLAEYAVHPKGHGTVQARKCHTAGTREEGGRHEPEHGRGYRFL